MEKLKNKDIWIKILFGLFLAFLLIQHHFVYMYHDDYGYLSLGYGTYEGGFTGFNYGISDIINFLKWHYMNWGGRVLYFFFEIIFMRAGLWVMQLVQSVIIFSIFLSIYKLLKSHVEESKRVILAALVILSYGLISLATLNQGVYWYTAAVLYLWPFCPFLLGIRSYNKYLSTNKKFWISISIILTFLAAFSQEQMGVLVAMYYGFSMLQEFFDKNKEIYHRAIRIVQFFVAFVGMLIVVLSPGNAVRSASIPDSFQSLSLLGKLKRQIPIVLDMNFGADNRLEVIMVCFAGLLCSYLIYKKAYLNRKLAIVNMAVQFAAFALVGSNGTLNAYKTLNEFVILVWLVAYSYNIVMYFIREEKKFIAWLYLAGGASQVAMFVVYSITTRIHIFFEIMLFFVIVALIYDFLVIIAFKKWATYGIIGYLCVASSYHASVILKGYADNATMNVYNSKVLSSGETTVDENGETCVVLHKLKDPEYSGKMSYEADALTNYYYIDIWMKNYYGYDQNVKFKWTSEK